MSFFWDVQFSQPRTLYSSALQKQKSSENPVISLYLLLCGFLEELTGGSPIDTIPKTQIPDWLKGRRGGRPQVLVFTSVLADQDTM